MSVHSIDHHAFQQRHAEEIAFFHYRLDIVNQWPDSEHKSALVRASLSRLRSLGA